jgi:hypothetical protein
MTVVPVRAAGATKTALVAGGTNNNQLKARRGSGRNGGGSGSNDGGNSDGNSNINQDGGGNSNDTDADALRTPLECSASGPKNPPS